MATESRLDSDRPMRNCCSVGWTQAQMRKGLILSVAGNSFVSVASSL